MYRPLLHQLLTLLRLTRVWNLLILVLAQYAAVIFLVEPGEILPVHFGFVDVMLERGTWTDPALFVLAASTCLIAAAGYVINDYFDVKIDLINKPARVVVGKEMTRRKAILLHVIFSSAGVFTGLLISWKVAVVNLLSAGLLWWYSANLKRGMFFGNLAIAVLTAAALLVLYIPFPQSGPAILLYAGFAFGMTLVREAVKDMEDVRGDQAYGCSTMPIRMGIPFTKIYSLTLILMLMATGFAVHVWLMPLPVYYFLALILLPLGLFSFRLLRADTVREFHQLSQWVKYILVLGIFSMALLP